MDIIEKIFDAVTETLYSVVGIADISDTDAIIGLSTLAIIIAVFLGSFWLLRRKIKLNESLSIIGSIGMTIGVILVFCIVCIIIQH